MSDHDTLPLTPHEDRAAMAAEAAMGLLDGIEAAEARRMARDDPQFAADIRAWSERLAALAETLPPVTPPAAARAAIMARIAPGAGASARPRVPRWLAGLIAGGAIAAAVVLVAPVRTWLLPPQPLAVAHISTGTADPMVVEARLATDGRKLDLQLVSGAMPPDRDAELWWVPATGEPPVSLGLVPRTGGHEAILPAAIAQRMAAELGPEPGTAIKLAVSDEPFGGSSTGQPTGSVLATGVLTRL